MEIPKYYDVIPKLKPLADQIVNHIDNTDTKSVKIEIIDTLFQFLFETGIKYNKEQTDRACDFILGGCKSDKE